MSGTILSVLYVLINVIITVLWGCYKAERCVKFLHKHRNLYLILSCQGNPTEKGRKREEGREGGEKEERGAGRERRLVL